jgi:tRNA/tmRNA/rRNA uracil-C5-methylase (TrmA/RlmC/RlmD family)
MIIDPPRKGCGDDFLRQLVAFAPRTIVYVSCNPETQARDVAALREAGYGCRGIQPFDMFPQTRHVEAVATLARQG